MEFLPPVAWVTFSATMMVETHIAGIGWSRHYRCETAQHIRAVAAVLFQGAWLWMFIRGLSMSLR